MIDRILSNYRESVYDFRLHACPDDPLSHLFGEWVEYYRLKAAIAQAIAPKTILEIGVRYGYSIAAFQYGCPDACVTGIDIDDESFGGNRGAIKWADKTLPRTRTTLIRGNSQEMARFPGGVYDLIHIDGQQDGDGSFRDLEKAIQQGRYILLDGYYWTRSNFLSASEFLYQYAEDIDYHLVIPGYAGELVIKVRERALTAAPPLRNVDLRSYFDTTYYRRIWDGGVQSDIHQGRRPASPRLRALFDLATKRRPSKLLDLGCGRGELSVSAAALGAEVHAIDYSMDAIVLATESIGADPALVAQVKWISDSVTNLPPDLFDSVVAADLVEHFTSTEMEALFGKVATILTPAGRFVLRCSNPWYFEAAHRRSRAAVARVGAYLPPDPRNHRERAMRLSRWTASALRRKLRKYFPFVRVWWGSDSAPIAGLARRLRMAEVATQTGIFAIASHEAVADSELLNLFVSEELREDSVRLTVLFTDFVATTIARGESFRVPVIIHNRSSQWLCSRPPHPVNMGYRWRSVRSGELIVSEGERTELAAPIPPGRREIHFAHCRAPSLPGEHRLELTLVQEGVRWFDDVNPAARITVQLTVSG